MLTRKHFEQMAETIKALPAKQRKERAKKVLPDLKASNPRFNERVFLTACGVN